MLSAHPPHAHRSCAPRADCLRGGSPFSLSAGERGRRTWMCNTEPSGGSLMARAVGRSGLVAAFAMLLAATACNDPQSPKPGADLLSQNTPLVVTTITKGSDIPAGYTAWVNDAQSQPVGANGAVTFLAPSGPNKVALYGVASNCLVTAEYNDPRWVYLLDPLAGATTFTLSCVSQGGLFVSTNTNGVDLPADGYTLTVDGGAGQPIATNGSVTYTDRAAGAHSVALSGVPANCTVSGSNSQT